MRARISLILAAIIVAAPLLVQQTSAQGLSDWFARWMRPPNSTPQTCACTVACMRWKPCVKQCASTCQRGSSLTCDRQCCRCAPLPTVVASSSSPAIQIDLLYATRQNFCGDGVCQFRGCRAAFCRVPESSHNCPRDCAIPPPKTSSSSSVARQTCGNGICEGKESLVLCVDPGPRDNPNDPRFGCRPLCPRDCVGGELGN